MEKIKCQLYRILLRNTRISVLCSYLVQVWICKNKYTLCCENGHLNYLHIIHNRTLSISKLHQISCLYFVKLKTTVYHWNRMVVKAEQTQTHHALHSIPIIHSVHLVTAYDFNSDEFSVWLYPKACSLWAACKHRPLWLTEAVPQQQDCAKPHWARIPDETLSAVCSSLHSDM